VAKVTPSHLAPARFVRSLLTAVRKNPKLAACSQESLFGAAFDLARLGLEADGRHAHIVPYGTTATLIVDYKGLVALAYRSGKIKRIHAEAVRLGDFFTVENGEVTHRVRYDRERGEIFAFYALAELTSGGVLSEVMTSQEVDAIRQRSRGGDSGPWKTDPEEMGKKTVFRRLAKWLPLSEEFRDATEADGDNLPPLKKIEAVEIKTAAFEMPTQQIDDTTTEEE